MPSHTDAERAKREAERRQALAGARAGRRVNDDIDLPAEMADEDDDEGFFSFGARINRRRQEAIEAATGSGRNIPEGRQPATPVALDPLAPSAGELTQTQQSRRSQASQDLRNPDLSREEKNRRARARVDAAEEEARLAREAFRNR